MAVNPNFTNANATTPFSGVGGLNPTFANVNIQQGGSITIGSSVVTQTQLIYNKDVSGTLQTAFGTAYFGGAGSPQYLTVTTYDQAGNLDNQLLGDVLIGGKGTAIGPNYSVLNIGEAGTGVLGHRYIDRNTGTIGATYATYQPNSWSLNGLSTIQAGSYQANALSLMSSLKGTFPTSFS